MHWQGLGTYVSTTQKRYLDIKKSTNKQSKESAFRVSKRLHEHKDYVLKELDERRHI